MGRFSREIFKRGNEFVAVRPIRLSSKDQLKPGTKIDKKNFRQHHLRSLYMRRRIGVLGSKWAKAMLADLENSHARPEVVIPNQLKPAKVGKKWTIPGLKNVFDTKKAATQHINTLKASAKKEAAAEAAKAKEEADKAKAEEEEAAAKAKAEEEEAAAKAKEDDDWLDGGPDDDDTSGAGEDKIVITSEPVKVGSRWVVENHPDKFTSKKKAQAFLDAQEK